MVVAAPALLPLAAVAVAMGLSGAPLRPLRSIRMDVSDAPPSPDGDADLDMSFLQQRIAEVQGAETERQAERQVSAMMQRAANWRTGRCTQRTVLVLEDWVRKLQVEHGLLACGTYNGEVIIADFNSGEVLKSWEPGEERGSEDEWDADAAEWDDADDDDEAGEVTAIDFDGEHVSSGDASGAVYFRQWGGAGSTVLRAQHAGVVTGVHWDGGALGYSSSADRRLVAWEMESGAEKAALTLSRPILSMDVCENYVALGLDDGSVVLATLSPLRQLFAFQAHKAPVSAVRLVTVSQLLTSSAGGEVNLWRLDEEEGSERRCSRFRGHSAPVVCLDGDAEKVVSGARDGTVRVWDLTAGELRFMLQGFTAYIGSVQISPSWLIADGTNNNVVCMDFSGKDEEDEGEDEEEDED